jgi:hypothetical protein
MTNQFKHLPIRTPLQVAACHVGLGGEVSFGVEPMSETTCKAVVNVYRLEPGTHISRKTIDRNVLPPVEYEIPEVECKEKRPDWGEYLPVKTMPALERALRKRGAFDAVIGPDCVFYFGFVS